MNAPRWALDANPLGMLFRNAYGEFRTLLAAQPRAAADAASPELGAIAARRMSDALDTIRHALARQAGARAPV
ncbi:MAG TPA: hypothetical protein VGC21_10165, partial [Telluria sp.]